MLAGTIVWTCNEEKPGVYRKKGDGNGVTGKEEKTEAQEKISGCSEGEYGRSWGEGEGHWKQDAVEEHHTLWLPLIKRKGRKKKNKRHHKSLQQIKRSNILKALTSTKWDKRKELIVSTFKLITRPILEYANAWSPIISNINIKKLQTIQNIQQL